MAYWISGYMNKRHFICLPYLALVIDNIGSEKFLLFTRLNANLRRVSRPEEILV